ncbi:TadE family type IV pilus minor pilin [Streptomyces pristinaespiralis]|uniref:TadE family type IV pilus minor pilin n=1 Tax=Streptomyces pristinaespiralis TaxID=38300 RepID=UPI003F4D68A7
MRSSEAALAGAGAGAAAGAAPRARTVARPGAGAVSGAGTSAGAEGGPGRDNIHDRSCGKEFGERGSVTAEAAVAVPALVVFTMGLIWALMAASAQIQCVDAARAGARAAARSEPRAAAVAAARSAAPSGSDITLTRSGDLWRVRVEADTPGPGALALTLSAEAAALAEDTVGRGPKAVVPAALGGRESGLQTTAGSGPKVVAPDVVVRRATGPWSPAGQASPDGTPEGTARIAVLPPPPALVAASGPAQASQGHRHRGGAQERGGAHVLFRADRGGRGSDTGPVRVVGAPGAERPERLGTATAATVEVVP